MAAASIPAAAPPAIPDDMDGDHSGSAAANPALRGRIVIRKSEELPSATLAQLHQKVRPDDVEKACRLHVDHNLPVGTVLEAAERDRHTISTSTSTSPAKCTNGSADVGTVRTNRNATDGAGDTEGRVEG